jgi:hypothetical protein
MQVAMCEIGFSSPTWQSRLPGWAQVSDQASILSLLPGLFSSFDSHRAG